MNAIRTRVRTRRHQALLNRLVAHTGELNGLTNILRSQAIAMTGPLRVQARSAAVVLSSAALQNRHHGADIDAHDLVFRVNLAPTIGYESDVGKRTTHRVLGRDWIFREHRSECLLWCPTTAGAAYNFEYLRSIDRQIGSHNLPAAVISPQRWHKLWQDKWFRGVPTNGFRAVSLALLLADSVTVYGMDTAGMMDPMRRHYFDDSSASLTQQLVNEITHADFDIKNTDYWPDYSQLNEIPLEILEGRQHQTFVQGHEYDFYGSHCQISLPAKQIHGQSDSTFQAEG